MRWAHEALAVFVREWRAEWRTRVALSSVVLFAVVALVLIALSLRDKTGIVVDSDARPSVAAALLWVILFFTAATGLGRAFVQEEERGTALALRLMARGTAVWTGKFAANASLLLGLAALTTPILIGILETPVKSMNLWLLVCVLSLGCVGIAAVFTMTSALVAQASVKGGLLAALSFPILVPLLLAGVHGTKAALGVGNPQGFFAPGTGDLQVLVSYAIVAVTTSLMLFDFVWND
ncbi:MAG: heme exporter protein CcmB [Cytophagales bacterium]|nr:heme exporter protein CcmB [Armatimonadota bacterium]